jgi:hypothetical protein
MPSFIHLETIFREIAVSLKNNQDPLKSESLISVVRIHALPFYYDHRNNGIEISSEVSPALNMRLFARLNLLS